MLYDSSATASTNPTALASCTASSTTDCNFINFATTAAYGFFKIYESSTVSVGNWICRLLEPFKDLFPYRPERYIYKPNETAEDDPQHLAPIPEALEVEGIQPVIEHLEKLLNDEAYRNQQLTSINKVNRKLGLQEVQFNAEAIRQKLQEIQQKLEAQENAQCLFSEVFTPEEILKLKTDKKLIISRNNLTFELLPDASINQLLPDGQKQGWCLISKEGGLPLHDILVMKKLLLENTPEIVLQTAHKRQPFGG